MGVDIYKICQFVSKDKKIISCYGCCGRAWKTQKKIERDIDFNTCDFKTIKIPSTLRLLQFRDRISENPDDLMPSGICSNLVKFENEIYACPLHKNINKLIPKSEFLAIHKKDLRHNHCDVNFECKTINIWKVLSPEQREEYLKWLADKKFTAYEYSIMNLNGELILEFMSKKYENF